MFRVGFGYDAHRFRAGRKLVLGGVIIKSKRGLDGHSDADALTHALMDALLGACGLKDIGFYFPNSDKKYKNISSIKLLEKVYSIIRGEGYKVVNVDCSLVAEAPRIAPYARSMKTNISKALNIKPDAVGIKATTNENMGFIGRGEGLASFAVCLLKANRGVLR